MIDWRDALQEPMNTILKRYVKAVEHVCRKE